MITIMIAFLSILGIVILGSVLFLVISYNKLVAYGNRMEEARATYDNMRTKQDVSKEDLAMARRYYNAVVKEYNDRLMAFPNNVIANVFQFQRMDAFEVTESERDER